MEFERNVLRRIFGPTKQRDALDELIRHKYIINYIKA
jgi:hypothetical protein